MVVSAEGCSVVAGAVWAAAPLADRENGANQEVELGVVDAADLQEQQKVVHSDTAAGAAVSVGAELQAAAGTSADAKLHEMDAAKHAEQVAAAVEDSLDVVVLAVVAWLYEPQLQDDCLLCSLTADASGRTAGTGRGETWRIKSSCNFSLISEQAR